MDLDFCIVCLKQTMGGLYCSSACRTEDYANAAKAAMASANANGKGVDINAVQDQLYNTYASYAVGYKPHAMGYKHPRLSHDLSFRQSSSSSQHSQHNIFAIRDDAKDDSTDNWTDESDTSAESSTFSRVSQDTSYSKQRQEAASTSTRRKNSTFHSYQSFADIEPTIIQPGEGVKEDADHSSRYSASAASYALAGILSKSQTTTTSKMNSISSWLFSV